ncbi:MAG: hypothetical protein Kilf2KO_24940 [Rhodospirillales bacterium]
MGFLEPHERHRRGHGAAPLTVSAAAGPEEARYEGEVAGDVQGRLPPGPLFRVHGGGDIARIAAVARALDRPAVVISNGAIGWHLFAAMIHAGEAEGAPLTFLFDAGDRAGPAAEALRSGASWVFSTVGSAQCAALHSLAQTVHATLLEELPERPQDCPCVEDLKQRLLTWHGGDAGQP